MRLRVLLATGREQEKLLNLTLGLLLKLLRLLQGRMGLDPSFQKMKLDQK